tara:strand:+ start:1539 stop:1736 length:198 start_codon:yes stop_codon:yes gene_type:complete
MKSNFKKENKEDIDNLTKFPQIKDDTTKDLTAEEFEDFILKSGAKGSFMIYRSKKKNDELGIDTL